MNRSHPDRLLLLALRLGAFLCFLGWTWVHFYWQGPYSVLLWQDSTFAWAERFGISWEEFVGTGANDGVVQRWIGSIGWLYLAGCVLSLTVRKGSKVQWIALAGGTGLLAIMAYAKFVSAQRQLPMLVEHGGQILMPLLLVVALRFGVRHRATIGLAMAATILTFAGHGAYALGWPWPTPANFFGMTRVILGFEQDTARVFLLVAGILDLVICLGIFLPSLRLYCVAWAAIWGLLTALARPVAGMSLDLNYWGSDQFLHEAILRAPHFLIPLYLFLLWRSPRTATEEAPRSRETPEPARIVSGIF